MAGCKLDNSPFHFDGPAADTVQALKYIYHSFGDFGHQMVENVFASIKEPWPARTDEPPLSSEASGAGSAND